MNEVILDLYTPVKGRGVKIAFPESTEPRTLKAVRYLADHKLCSPVLIGDHASLVEHAAKLGLSLDGIEVIPHKPEQFAPQLAQLRREKGLSVEEAQTLLKDEMYFATMLLQENIVRGVVSGAVHPTAHTLKPALQIIKTRPNTPLASTFIVMETPKGIYFFADCSLNIELTAEQLTAVGVATAHTAQRFGIEPVVAFLSFSTKASADHERAKKVAAAAAEAAKALPGVRVDGELQVDAAMDKVVCDLKAPGSPVAGNANVFIFPNLESGNIGYKLVQRFAGGKAIGPIVQGLNKPVNDLSRGCTSEEIVDVACITVIQALNG